MKGMQKIKRGTGFRGVCEYVLENGRGTIIGGNMVGVTPIELTAEFGQSRKVREDIEKPVWHNSLRLPANEHISTQQWNDIADDYLTKMGFGDLHQRLYVLHDDLEGQHIHIIASRIDLTGKLYLGQNENLKSTQYIYQLEKDHNLVITQLEQDPDTNMLRQRPPKSGEKGLSERTGEIPPRLQIQAIIDFASADYPNFSQFVDRIHYAGVSIILSGKTGIPQGISFGMNGQAFKGSGLGKSYAWKQVQDRIDYKLDRDQFLIDDLRSKAVKNIGSEFGLEIQGYEPTRTDQDHLKNILAKNEVVKNERKNSKTEGAILGSGATKNDGERIGGLGGANGNRPEPYSGTDRTSDTSSQESECRVRQNTVAPSAVPATATDDLRSTDFADAFGFGINRRDISNIRDVAVQLSDLAASISENRDSESASGKERPNTIRPITKEHAAKITAWEEQSEALSAEKYRITLKPRAEKDRNGRKLFDQNYGNTVNKSDRDAVGISEKFWTKDEITLEIAKLRTKNARGYDIYLTPIDDSKHFIVVDDMSPDKEKALLDAGIKPAIIQRSSANNKQAIVVIDRVKSPNEQKLANLLVMKLNKKFGDVKFSGVIHPFRMAGFSNKKAGKNNYLTTLEISICRQCNISMIDMQRLRDDDSLKQLESDKLKKDQSIREEIDKEYCRRLQNIEYLQSGDDDVECEYRRKVRKIVGLVNKNGWKLDWSRVDFAATKELLKAGYNPYDIENAIIFASPGLSDRHRDAIRYATDTVRNASMAQDVSRHLAEQTQRGEHDRSLDIK